MFWEKKLENWVNEVRHRAALPLRLELWNGQKFDFGSYATPDVTVRVPHASALTYLLTPSLANLGEAYVEGKIEVEGKIREIIAVGNALAANTLKADGKFSRITRTFRHNKEKDAEAIRYHYDVSNDFYKLWLDQNMVYSCAYFENGDEDLDTAQLKKIDHILTKIQVQPGQTLLDIGCGWGALVLRAAQKFGAKCVGITLSENQYALAKERVKQAGLEDRVEIRLQDYRDITGSFDRITSVGMFEHVGLNNLPMYFSRIRSLLTDDGIAMNHGITTTDIDNGESPYGGGEFIDKYVFPHGELPHIGMVLKTMQEGGLEVFDVENLRRHYAKTCGIWADNLEARADEVRKTVDDRRFRIWRVYLAGSSYGFERDWVSLYQVVCRKAGRSASTLPWSRDYIYQAAQ
ncbi:SAM-dependent methyltransferase [Collimonas fungivorans]|uniref:Cyclopropane fatty acid synthase-like methyltransferase n=1 Tax=Collimonas fungivorans (strain Ter331) TaxID=1005048 RepID=G0AFV3_COLFT|nr:cyclopropane-fatty-acyl-phospholipid synthase family protein [Collimonas fungivorans]AEK63603.1 Cyclopropane fatty acid synthase-like methyltransferase [Collimonas fungivorans Ter331]